MTTAEFVAALRAGDLTYGATVKTWARKLALSEALVRKHLRAAAKDGLVIEGARTRSGVYWWVRSEEEVATISAAKEQVVRVASHLTALGVKAKVSPNKGKAIVTISADELDKLLAVWPQGIKITEEAK